MGFSLGSILGSVGVPFVSQWLGNALTPRGTNKPQPGEDAAKQLTAEELNWLLQMLPMRVEALSRAYANMSPDGTRGIAMALGNQAINRGTQAGFANARTLGRSGYSSSVQDAAKLQGRNMGVNQANSTMASLMSPQAQAQNAIGQAGLYTQEGLRGSGLSSLAALGNIQAQQQNIYNSRPMSGGEAILGALGNIAPYLGRARSGSSGNQEIWNQYFNPNQQNA